MARNRFRVQVQVPMLREVYDGLGDEPETGVNLNDVAQVMNRKAAELNRRVFEDPWLERVEESYADDPTLVSLVFFAKTEPA